MSRAIRPDRSQMFLLPPSLDEWVPPEHPVRFVASFVEALDLGELKLRESAGDEGRPHYAGDLLLAVWLFGWMERVRSSRSLEKACLRDLAFLWLTGNLHPDHNTLWRFFRDNRAALRRLFKQVIQVAVKADLVGFALHALDGTKIQAQSSMEKALHQKTLQERLTKLDALIDEQMAMMEATEATEESYALPEPFQDAAVRREKIRQSLAELEAADRAHLHPREREATVVKTRTHHTLGYNGQVVVDEKSDLIVAQTVVTDEQDRHQLVPMVEAVKETVGRVADETVADCGYHNGEQIAEAERKQLPVLVGLQAESSAKGELSKSHFRYDVERDGYVCPRGEFLPLAFIRKPTTGKPHPVSVYRCHNQQCPIRSQCTSDPKGRSIKRLPFEEAVERQAAKQSVPEKKGRMERRKAIVEHIFGLMKLHHGFRRFTVRGLDGVCAQFALLCSALNLCKLYVHWRAGKLALAA